MAGPRKLNFLFEKKYFIVCVLLTAVIAIVNFSDNQGPLAELYDYGEHVASIREMSVHLFSPGNPLIANEFPTLRYTPYIFLLAGIIKGTSLSLFTTIRLASLFSFIFFAAGIYLWSREYFRDREIPLYVLIVLLFFWGKQFGYSNEYSLKFYSYTAFYPSTLSFSLSLLGLYFWLKFIRYENRLCCLWFMLCSAFIFLTHSLTGSFFLLSAFVLTCTEGTKKVRNAGLFCVVCVLILLLSLLWPYYSFIEAVVTSTTTEWYNSRLYLYDYRNIYKVGPALLGVPAVLSFMIKREKGFLVWGFLACLLVYFSGWVFTIFLFERYIFFIMFFLHLSVAWYFRKFDALSFSHIQQCFMSPSVQSVLSLVCAGVMCGSIMYQGGKLGFEQAEYQINFLPRPTIHSFKNPLDNYKNLRPFLKTGDIVLSDPLTSWLIPAFTGAKIVALYHNNPMVIDNARRTGDVEKFFHDQTTLEERGDILRNYAATHVLLNRDRMRDAYVNRTNDYCFRFRITGGLEQDMEKLGTVIFERDDFLLLKLIQ